MWQYPAPGSDKVEEQDDNVNIDDDGAGTSQANTCRRFEVRRTAGHWQ